MKNIQMAIVRAFDLFDILQLTGMFRCILILEYLEYVQENEPLVLVLLRIERKWRELCQPITLRSTAKPEKTRITFYPHYVE